MYLVFRMSISTAPSVLRGQVIGCATETAFPVSPHFHLLNGFNRTHQHTAFQTYAAASEIMIKSVRVTENSTFVHR
jgi:hypothetical protein